MAAAVLPAPGLHHLVNGVPELLAHQGLVCVLHHDPVRFLGGHPALIEEALCLGFPKGQLPQIDRVVQDGPHRGGVPVKRLAPVVAVLVVVRIVLVEVSLWIEDIPLPEDLGHPYISYPIRKHSKNLLHHLCGFRVHDEVVAVAGVAIRGPRAKEHPVLGSSPMGRLCLFRSLACIEGVDHVGKGKDKVVQSLAGVDVLRQGEEANAFLLKVVLNVEAHLGVLSAKPGEVFHNHRVDPAGFDVPYHPLERGPVKIGTAPAVVTVAIHNLHVVLLAILGEDRLLGLDAARLPQAAIVLAEPAINGCLCFFHRGRLLSFPHHTPTPPLYPYRNSPNVLPLLCENGTETCPLQSAPPPCQRYSSPRERR